MEWSSGMVVGWGGRVGWVRGVVGWGGKVGWVSGVVGWSGRVGLYLKRV